MKKIISGLLVGAMLMSVNVPALASNTYKEFYVSPNGNDSNAGTKSAPFATLAAAQKAVRNVNQSMTGDIVVNIEEGTYYLDQMLDLGTLDSGYNGHRVIWRGVGDAPVISGGTPVSGFSDTDGDGIYTADLTSYKIDYVYQLSVNGLKRHMAKGATLAYGQLGADGSYYYDDPNIDPDGASFDKDTNGDYVMDANYPDYDGIYVSKKDIGMYNNASDMYFLWNGGFYGTMVPVEDIKKDPSNSNQLIAMMSYGWYDNMVEAINLENPTEQPSTQPYADRGFTIINALELLDEPGEFYFDKTTKKLHYMPVKGENMSKATVVVPRLETLVFIDGNDVDDKAKNITLTNLHFTDSEWNISEGFRIGQSIDTSGNGQTAIAPSAILAMRADGIEFIDNIISNTGANGINYYNAVSNSVIEGNAFYDIGVTAITSGAFNHNYKQLKEGANSNQSIAVPDANKNDSVDVADEITTKVTVSSNYGAGIDPQKVPVTDGSPSQHHWYYGNGIGALKYPGGPGPDNGGWTDIGSKHIINATWMDTTILNDNTKLQGFKGIWCSQPDLNNTDKIKDITSYVILEFIRPYDINEIKIAIDENYKAYCDDNAIKDYSIYVSNDRTFAEKQFVGTQYNSAAGIISPFTSIPDGKFKYVMVSRADSNQLAISRIWVGTKERKPYVKNERCSDITISNNHIKRAGVTANHAVGIIVTSGDRYTITHNEVHNVGYSGMSIGYTWTNVQTCSDMNVSYNYIYDSCRTSYDGGGIYTLGPQPGSVYSYNYIESTNHSIRGFYTDNGSSFFTVSNNYIGNTQKILGPYSFSVSKWTDGCGKYVKSDGTEVHCQTITTTSYKYYIHSGTDSKETAKAHSGETSADGLTPVPTVNSIHDCVYKDNYSTHTYTSTEGVSVNDYEAPIVEPIGILSEGSYEIVKSAGLEDHYKHIYDLVPENRDNMYEDATHMKNEYEKDTSKGRWTGSIRTAIRYAMVQEIENTLRNGKFGEGLGMYPTEYKYELSNILSYFYRDENESIISRWSFAQDIRKDIHNAVRRYSVDETIEMCEELIAGAKTDGSIGSYPQSAVSDAKSTLATVKNMSEMTPAAEYQKLIAAEEVYNTLLNTKYSADIVDVKVAGAERIMIDSVDQTVTVYMPYGESLTVSDIAVIPDAGSLIHKPTAANCNLAEGIKVPVFCKGNGKFRVWTVKAVNAAAREKTTLGANDWTVMKTGKTRISYGNGYTVLGANQFTYVSTDHGQDAETTIKLSPISQNDKKSFTMLFGIKSNVNFDYANTKENNDRYELTFDGNSATLYAVTENGKTQLVQKSSSGINWNDNNTISYKITASGIEVSVNGTTMTGSASGDFGRYAGIYTPDVNVKVY